MKIVKLIVPFLNKFFNITGILKKKENEMEWRIHKLESILIVND